MTAVYESGIDRSTLAGLAKWLDITNEMDSRRMIEEVDCLLAAHGRNARHVKEWQPKDALRNDQLRPADVVNLLKPLLKDACSLAKRIRKLRPAIRLELHPTYRPTDKGAIAYSELERLERRLSNGAIADNELERLVRCLSDAVERYKRSIVRHRPVDDALRRTVYGLQYIFAKFSAKDLAPQVKNRKEREFIHEALTLAGIVHPDPDDQKSRFNNLLLRPKGGPPSQREHTSAAS